MNSMIKITAAAALALAAASPALAQSAGAMTCGQYLALDGVGKGQAAEAVMRWTQETANASDAGILAAQLSSTTAEQVQQLIDRRCSAASGGANIVAELKAGDKSQLSN